MISHKCFVYFGTYDKCVGMIRLMTIKTQRMSRYPSIT